MKAIKIPHGECDCIECIKDSMYGKHISRAFSTWQLPPDNLDGTADEFIGGLLFTINNPVTVYNSPGGKAVKTIQPNKEVGRIFSYVEKDGSVWWQLESGNFVKHSKDVFDSVKLKQSLDALKAAKEAQIKAKAEARAAENDNPLYKTGKLLESIISFEGLQAIIIGVIVAIIAGILIRIFAK